MIKRSQLTTNKGSLTNACIIEANGKELLFSYNTLVGVRKAGVCYFQREGAASSRTTAKHITLWAGGATRKEVSEAEIQMMGQ